MRICLLRLALLALLGAAACGDEWDGTLDGELRSLGEVGVAGCALARCASWCRRVRWTRPWNCTPGWCSG